jgi:hypothetical protein
MRSDTNNTLKHKVIFPNMAPKLVNTKRKLARLIHCKKITLEFHALNQEDTNWVGTVGACSYGGLHYQTGFWLCPLHEDHIIGITIMQFSLS